MTGFLSFDAASSSKRTQIDQEYGRIELLIETIIEEMQIPAMPIHPILRCYDALRTEAGNDIQQPVVRELIGEIFHLCCRFLNDARKVDFVSRVDGKEYFGFRKAARTSRAVNRGLYSCGEADWIRLERAMTNGGDLQQFTPESITALLYTMAISFCASIDLLKKRDQKTPGTFFEYFIAHFYAWRVGVNPRNSMPILNLDDVQMALPTDFVFNLGRNRQKFHMPIKTSTRERSVMLWAHQRLLDGVYGTGSFMGTPVLLAENKTDSNTREVVEICLPDQWRLYQLYIAKLTRIYYLDLPAAYRRLNDEFPPIHVRPFGEFFFEWNRLTPG